MFLAFLVLAVNPPDTILRVTQLTPSSEFYLRFIGWGRYRMAPEEEVSEETLAG
jgi:hypothetical protein